MKKFALAFLNSIAVCNMIVLSGCAIRGTPYITYDEKKPLVETAIFSAFDKTQKLATVDEVDGRALPLCYISGYCPFWVRVLPGEHTFKVRYQTDVVLFGSMMTAKVANFSLTVPDMKPSHVYTVEYQKVGSGVYATVRDLGENPTYGVRAGFSGEYFPATFSDVEN
ncbi:hypothetical protein HT746_07005 [Burkholderia pyrrocinia]|uniref:hypothetical protein n=1 Tax=Burkholderia pyrrocinia TaxID=60550 RepID=UPI0015777643|nr:hypothetical protein [Burkholderia pyrrocinia]NTX26883.1 hypothetical protein [Burkholderia pyrrocinia]